VDALLTRLEAPALHVVHAAWEAAKAGEMNEGRRRQVEVARLTRAAETTKRLLAQVGEPNPENSEAIKELVKTWNGQLKERDRLQSMATAEPSLITQFTTERWAKLLGTFHDLRALWDAPTTAMIERKQLIRTMIEAVIVEERTDEHFTVRILWVDGAPDSVIEVKRFGYYLRLIAQWAAEGLTLSQIARKLNEMGLRTRLGREWSPDTLSKIVRNAGIHVVDGRHRPAVRC